MATGGAAEGRVTTHVLDTGLGKPAAGLRIDVYRIETEAADSGARAGSPVSADPRRMLLATHATNADGRCDGPVIAGEDMRTGVYEIVFHAGAYLDRTQGPAQGPRFLDVIPIRFGIADAQAHYHVPLLLSAFAYSTYRGS